MDVFELPTAIDISSVVGLIAVGIFTAQIRSDDEFGNEILRYFREHVRLCRFLQAAAIDVWNVAL